MNLKKKIKIAIDSPAAAGAGTIGKDTLSNIFLSPKDFEIFFNSKRV